MFNIKIFNFITILFIIYISNVLAFNEDDFEKAKNYLKCQNCNLTDADFSNLKLQGIDLEQSNLSGANFSGSDLSIAKKEKFNLPSNLSRVNLKNANFTNANLSGVNFEGAYMKNVNLIKKKELDQEINKFKIKLNKCFSVNFLILHNYEFEYQNLK